jgi:hypothetical protein
VTVYGEAADAAATVQPVVKPVADAAQTMLKVNKLRFLVRIQGIETMEKGVPAFIHVLDIVSNIHPAVQVCRSL